jgi:MoaA/NifB/PqqE/SkfB family radical SAM enzyme
MKRARFSKVHVEISSICNLQCSFCPEVIREKKLMEPELFRRILAQVAPLTDQVAFHLMGDPLVHPKIEELVTITEEAGAKIFLVTNGVLLREKNESVLLRAPFRQVNFSLHSFPDNFGDKDPGPYLERIFAWTERAFAERPDLYVNYRLWNLTETKGSGPQNREILRRIEERFGRIENLEIDVTTQKSRLVKSRLYLHFDTEFTWPGLDLPVLGSSGTCHGLSSHFGILVNGTVVPCCLDKEGAIPLGNVNDRPIADILGGSRAQAILKGFRERRLVEKLCQRCQYIERFNGN